MKKVKCMPIKRTVASFGIIMTLVLQMLVSPHTVLYANAAGSHSTSGYLSLADTEVKTNEMLVDNGDGTYTFKMEVGSDTFVNDLNANYSSGKEGYFVAPYAGTYLLDLWGGNGADGEATSAGEGGQGGSGAHLYGTIALNKGDVLYYTLGGHGQQTTVTDKGGGANGNGGGLGDIVTSSYKVGGGGGYSAIYLFSAENGQTGYDVFSKDYLDESGNLTTDSILEADRTTRYIMIAGGGGGGGAGDGFIITDIFGGNNSQVGRADGGNAGGYDSAAGTITGTGIVEGVFYAGSDGKSSGTSTAYVGHGGRNVPGELADTITTLIKGAQPNDWFSTYDAEKGGGAGGSGDMRGGAGGAGYCGGSGGVMTAIVEANNVGGGGGGSSFVATGHVDVDLSSTEKSDYENAGYISTSNNEQEDGGGLVNITFLAPAVDTDIVDKVDLQIPTLSKYFELTKEITVNDAADRQLTCTATDKNSDGAADCYVIDDAVVLPAKPGNKLTVEITFKPVDGFAGGNDVPVFSQDLPAIMISQVVDGEEGEVSSHILDDGVSYLNVPLQFLAIGKSHMTNETDVTYELATLYDDKYTEVRDVLEKAATGDMSGNSYVDWKYDFIAAISDYSVSLYGSDAVLTQAVTPTESTKYRVFFTVTPKTGSKALVGDVVGETIFSDIATITILEEGTGSLDGTDIKYTKSLEYDADADQYMLALNVKASVVGTVESTPDQQQFTSDTGSYVIPADGYYMIQAWGGNGGNGGNSGIGSQGGSGGNGGYVIGYIHLNKEDVIVFSKGANGSAGNNGSGLISAGKGGNGGGYTMVTFASPILIAGGGGGGAGYNWGSESGDSVDNSAVPSTILDADYSDYNGGNGSSGDNGGGSAGSNFRASTVLTDVSTLSTSAQATYNNASSSDYTNNGGGAVYITCLQLDASEDAIKELNEAKLSNYSLTADIYEYFGIDTSAITCVNEIITDEADKNISINTPDITDSDDVANSADVYQETVRLTVSDIDPLVSHSEPTTSTVIDETTKEEVEVTTITSTAEFTIRIPLATVDKFVGGYDVPLLSAMQLGKTGKESVTPVPIVADDETDFANVGIHYTFDSNDMKAFEHTIIKGEKVELEDLYEAVTDDGDWIWDGYAAPVISVPSDFEPYPNETTSYPITLDIEPTADAAAKAVVKGTLTQVSKSLTATVYVNYSVTTQSDSHLTVDNGEAVTAEDYVGVLKADGGYKLPAAIDIQTKDSGSSVDFSYNPKTGEINISAETIAVHKDNLVIMGAATANTFSLYTVYKDLDGTTVTKGPIRFVAGSEIDPSDTTICGDLFTEPSYNPAEYDFAWSNGDVEAAIANNTTFTMPGNNLYVVGEFVPLPYAFTVEYVDEEGQEIADSVKETKRFGEAYSVTASQITGYALASVKVDGKGVDTSVVVEGNMPSADRTITFIYEKLEGTIKVSYIKRDTNELINEVEKTVAAYDEYRIPSPDVLGYTPEKTEISGVADEHATGMQYIVYYNPKQYTITFEPDGGSLAAGETAKLVQYNMLFGYHADTSSYETGIFDSGTYDGLPTPVKAGYTFLGWYIVDDESTEDRQVTESTTVDITSDITLTAKWEAETYTVTIQLVDEDGLTIADGMSYGVSYGDGYNAEEYIRNSGVELPVCGDGTIYSEWKMSGNASGNMPAQNIVVTVTYYFNSYNLNVEYYVVSHGDKETKLWFGETTLIRYNKTYSVEKSITEAYAAHADTWPEGMGSYTDYFPQQEVYAGIMPAEDVLIKYYYVTDTPVVSVTVEWGELVYDYTRGEWNPETHQYEGDTITESNADENNYVKVTNSTDSTIKINAEFTYSCEDEDFSSLQPVFTLDNGEAKSAYTVRKENLGAVGQDESTTAVLDFSGQLWKNTSIPDDVPSDTLIPFGILKVTITGGDPK